MTKEIVLTGITTSGTPHLGDYIGAIRPAIEASRQANTESYFFLADFHALIKCQQPERVMQSRLEIAASWLACGLDPELVTFYRQSDIPEIAELNWLLTCVTGKGLMNRAHAYKAAVDDNLSNNQDADFGVTMGLFCYPVLMAADILAFNAHKVPVGRDQIQHIEMARDIAGRFNHIFGERFVLPEAVVSEASDSALLKGLDGRKMSKSYNNTIPLFEGEKKLKKAINKIITNTLEPGEAKDPQGSTVFEIYQAFATPDQTAEMRQKFADGIAWGQVKKELFELINGQLAQPREIYNHLMDNPAQIEEILQAGAKKARLRAQGLLAQLRQSVGLVNFT